MTTYYALFAEQLSRPVVSVPYVDAFRTGKINASQVHRVHRNSIRFTDKVLNIPMARPGSIHL